MTDIYDRIVFTTGAVISGYADPEDLFAILNEPEAHFGSPEACKLAISDLHPFLHESWFGKDGSPSALWLNGLDANVLRRFHPAVAGFLAARALVLVHHVLTDEAKKGREYHRFSTRLHPVVMAA